MTRKISIVGTSLLVMMMVIVGVMFFWMVNPVVPITYSNIRIVTPVVKAGNNLIFDIYLVKESIYPATISRILISCNSKRVFPLTLETGALPPGEHDVRFYVPIPHYVVPGKYELRSISVYEVNPLRNVVTGFRTPCFEVIR
jgi:hypothetical protein